MASGLLLVLLIAFAKSASSAPSTSSQPNAPPLQWINLSGLLTGDPPPPLKDASIGYNDPTRTLIIFGGQAESGVAQSQTYLLNLDTLTWSTASATSGIGSTPPARSAAVSGHDAAANSRVGHLVAGGIGSDGSFLSDVWEYDFNNQFWEEVTVASGGPAVLAVGGGIDDINVSFDTSSSATPINTFYAFGGSSSPVSLTDAWELQVSGTLSPNTFPGGTTASWTRKNVNGSLPSVSGQSGTVYKQKLISFGGCEGTASANISCVTRNATVVDVSAGTSLPIAGCVAPRLRPAVVANRNTFTDAFNNQAFVMLGTFNTSTWNDSGGSQKGEVDILDFSQGTWTRVLPSGDPGSSGTPTFPSPRSGVAALSYPLGLVGSTRSGLSDTIVFGGQDASGNYLGEMWLLRSYHDSITSSGAKWSGFGNGNLQTGVNATGQGVSIQFLAACVEQVATTNPSGTSSAPASASASVTSSPAASTTAIPGNNLASHGFDTAVSHKTLAPVSVALLLPAIILYRLSQPAGHPSAPAEGSLGLQIVSFAVTFVAFGAGLAGLILSFTTIVATPQNASLTRRSLDSSIILRTGHGRTGLALFVLLYVTLPILYALYLGSRYLRARDNVGEDGDAATVQHLRTTSDHAEKPNGASSPEGQQSALDRSSSTTPAFEMAPSPRRRHRSLTGSSFFSHLLPTAERRSSESIAMSEPSGPSGPISTSPHSFEVVNRPTRRRHYSATDGHAFSDSSHRAHNGPPRRSLSDISWLDRRRSVSAVNEIDYALMQLHQQRSPPTPAGADVSTRALMNVAGAASSAAALRAPHMPPRSLVLLRLLLHALVLALSAFSLAALFDRAPLAAFIVFLVWTVACYTVLFALAWRGRPRDSALAVALHWLRGERYAAAGSMPGPSRPLSANGSEYAGPYLHQPLYAAATEDGAPAPYAHGPADDEAGSDEDEDTRQRRIEDEMARRDVSIVTVPKRKLWITNPS